MTAYSKRIGAAIAASALINMLFLIGIFLASEGTPVKPQGMNRSSPLRVGLLPAISGKALFSREPIAVSETANPPDRKSTKTEKTTVETESSEKALELESVSKERAVQENPQIGAGVETGTTEEVSSEGGDFLSDAGSSPVQREAGSESSGASLKALRSSFLVYLQNEIAQRKEYPDRARRRGTEGTVLLFLQVRADGTLRSCRLERSSGSSSLDRAAEKLVTGIFPSSRSPGKDLSCTVAVEYRIN